MQIRQCGAVARQNARSGRVCLELSCLPTGRFVPFFFQEKKGSVKTFVSHHAKYSTHSIGTQIFYTTANTYHHSKKYYPQIASHPVAMTYLLTTHSSHVPAGTHLAFAPAPSKTDG